MAVARETILLLEEIAANAVTPPTVQLVDGWLLRAWPEAPFRRSNSVLALRGEAQGLDARLALVEDFYRRRDLPVRYQLSPVVSPPELEDALIARGYALEVTSLVQTAAASRVVAATAPSRAAAEFEITTDETVDEAWLVANAGAHGADESSRVRLAVYARLLARLGPRAAAVALRLPDIGAAAAGFVVVERGWAGIFGMGTNPAARRRGVATAILHALAQHARDHGAAQLYLQVEEDNDPALALYARAGFAPAYRYHYRSLGVRELHG